MNPARRLGVTGVLLVSRPVAVTRLSKSAGGILQLPLRRPPPVTEEPTASVDPNFNPGATPTTVETTEPAKKKKKKEASPSPATESSPTESRRGEVGRHRVRTAYKTEFAICKSFGVKAVAEEYGVPANQIDAAIAVSEGYQPAFQQAAFEGCFDGFNAR